MDRPTRWNIVSTRRFQMDGRGSRDLSSTQTTRGRSLLRISKALSKFWANRNRLKAPSFKRVHLWRARWPSVNRIRTTPILKRQSACPKLGLTFSWKSFCLLEVNWSFGKKSLFQKLCCRLHLNFVQIENIFFPSVKLSFIWTNEIHRTFGLTKRMKSPPLLRKVY